MNQTRVAVITRTKNRPILLKRAIRSVLSQKYGNWTHVIVNDGGNAEEVQQVLTSNIDEYKGRLTVINNPTSVGMEASSNIGIRACSSEFVVIHDDDDSWEPDFLARCVEFMDSPNKPQLDYGYAGVITHILRIIEEMEGQEVRQVATEPFNTWMTSVSLYRLAAQNTFAPISFLFRRDVWEEIGGFHEGLPVLGDWDFHLQVCARHEIGLIPEILANYHLRTPIQAGDYGNTVVSAIPKHRTYENLYRNDLLRRDLGANKVGLGFLVNIGSNLENIGSNLENIGSNLENIGSNLENMNRQILTVENVLYKLKNNFLMRRLAQFFHR